jgi:hypothetical protein
MFQELFGDNLEAEVGIALSDPAKVLAVLIGERIEDESREFVKTLTVRKLRVAF